MPHGLAKDRRDEGSTGTTSKDGWRSAGIGDRSGLQEVFKGGAATTYCEER
jgi:hypothetical protein